jgi:hypothetical protein
MNQEKNIKDKILEQIRAGEITMEPRLYLHLKLAAFIVLSVSALASSIVLFNFMYFSIRMHHHAELLGFGAPGMAEFLRIFPWHFLFADIALLLTLQLMLRKFQAGYKVPALYLLAALVFGAAALGFILDRTAINDQIIARADHLPKPVGSFYMKIRHQPIEEGICRCQIISIEGSRMRVVALGEGAPMLDVEVPPGSIHATTSGLAEGDVIFIAGDMDDGLIRAYGVHKLPDTVFFAPGKNAAYPISD